MAARCKARDIAIGSCPSVCPSLCLSMTWVLFANIAWVASKLFTRIISSGSSIVGVYLLNRPNAKSAMLVLWIWCHSAFMRGGSSSKTLGGIAPISPFIAESNISVLRNRKNTNFIQAYFWNPSLVGLPKTVETRPEGPRAKVGFLGDGGDPPPHQLGVLGERCKFVTSRSVVWLGAMEKLNFGAFGDLRNHVKPDSQLLNLGGRSKWIWGTWLPLLQRRTAPDFHLYNIGLWTCYAALLVIIVQFRQMTPLYKTALLFPPSERRIMV